MLTTNDPEALKNTEYLVEMTNGVTVAIKTDNTNVVFVDAAKPTTVNSVSGWTELTRQCPRLRDLERWARRTRFSWDAYEQMKKSLQPLVGWGARQNELSTNEAWDTALQHLLSVLER